MRILLVAGGGIGNVVMATPAVAALADMGCEVHVRLEAEARCAAELLRGWAALAGVCEDRCPGPERFDTVVHTVWSRPRGIHPDERSPGPVDLRLMHEAKANMLPVRALGYVGPMPPAHVEFDAPAEAHELAPGGYWALATGCKADAFWERKRWSPRGWRELARRLPGPAVFLGAEAESRPWMSDGARLFDLTGKTTLREAAGLIAGARAFVGIDNGLAHVAGAVGARAVVLFGATSEVKSRPLGPRVRVLSRDVGCRPCQMTGRWRECAEWRCMGFPPEVAAAAALETAPEAGP